MRLEQFEGNKKFGEITTGRYTEVSDASVRLAWSADYSASEIDNDPDGLETVTCVFERLAETALSKVIINKTDVLHFYAGFNVWEN
mmetsp:Transcript_21320/g.28569  ORF Transcript_21320/g.28569 Transcript_21320/m.28569 type:complete len:86 (-) Transcript_21320:145-402(-)